MTSSHNKAALTLACALALAASVQAALAEPQRAPGTSDPVPANAPANLAPPAALGQGKAAQPPKGGAVAPPAPAADSVQSQPLSTPEAQLIGLIDGASGGFARDLWVGADRLLVEALLPRLPAAQGSPAMTDLMRRLLLSRADPPQGATRRLSLTAAKLDRLLAIGQLGTIEPLAQQVPNDLARPELLAPRVDALLYQGADGDACALAERARGRTDATAWTKRLAYCDALSGKVTEARISVDVLTDTGDEDPAFAALMARLVDKAKPTDVAPEHPSAVHFALLRQTGGGLADAALEHAAPDFLAAWAGFDKAPVAQRIAAGERAAASGALPAAALLSLYRAQPMKAQRLSAPFGAATLVAGVDGAAYAIQRVALSSDVNERAHLIAAALRSARERGVLPALAAAFGPDLAAIPATDDLVEIGSVLGACEALAGSAISSRRWLDLARAKGAATAEPALALRSLLSVRGLGADIDWSPDEMLARLSGAGPTAQARAGLEWELLRPFGLAQSSAMFLTVIEGPLMAPGPAPIPAVLSGLEEASAQGQVGATILYALIALGDAGPRGAHPMAVTAVVRALKRAGLDSDARAIAAEALAWRMP
jgi:hypothetical protein